jgi:hypothetical protein
VVGGFAINLDLNHVITPASLVGRQDNYNPGGNYAASFGRLRLGSGAAVTMTGLAGGYDGREVDLSNIGGFDITLSHNDTLSTAGNRFLLPGSTSVTIGTGMSVRVRYDGGLGCWLLSR